MATNLAEEGGMVSEDQINYYARRAAGGAGLLIVEFCAVDPGGIAMRRQLRIYEDRFLPGLARLAAAIKQHGARAAIQLHHAGRQSSSREVGVQPVAPSPIPCPVMAEVPRELSTDEIRGLVERYAEGARRAQEAGFDAVEFHGAHGYLICQFFSARSNRRTDEYGGDLRGRARFGIEILRRAREKVGADFPLLFRISADEHLEGGLTTQETAVIARLLEEAGADAIDVSAGAYGAAEWTAQPMLLPIGCLAPHAADIKRSVSVPVIVAGRINSARAGEKILTGGQADFIAMGRGLLADPDLPLKSAQGRDQEVARCLACNTCMDLVFKYAPIACLLNPDVIGSHPTEAPAPVPRKVLVVGAGPAGLEAARVARRRGHEVTLYEEKAMPGGPWAWRMHGFIHHYLKTLKRLGVAVQCGVAVDLETVARFEPDVVLATAASRPILPPFAMPTPGWVYTADEVVAHPEALGPRVVVLGGSNLACEVAETLSRRGKAVTIVAASRVIGYGLEPLIRPVVMAGLKHHGVEVVTSAEIVHVDRGVVTYREREGRQRSMETDAVVLALGYEPREAFAASLTSIGIAVHTLPACDSPRAVIDAVRHGAAVARQV
jgi:2,4-dienoyl-CoA reductase-like NADH-dependent reductase (Old Yellow Enzyme family)